MIQNIFRPFVPAIAFVIMLGAVFIISDGFHQPLKDDEIGAWSVSVLFHTPKHFITASKDYHAAAGPLNYGIWAVFSSWKDYDPRWMRLTSTLFGGLALWCIWILLPIQRNRERMIWWFSICILPISFYLCFTIMTDILFLFFLSISLVLLIQRNFCPLSCLGAGLILGFAVLGRVWALPAAFGIFAALLIFQKPIRALLLLLPSLMALAFLWILWQGLTPPATQNTYALGKIAPLSFTHSIAQIGLFAFPVIFIRSKKFPLKTTGFIAIIAGLIGIICEFFSQSSIDESAGGFLSHGIESLTGSTSHFLMPLIWGFLFGFGTVILTHLLFEACSRKNTAAIAILGIIVGLLCANGMNKYYLERYAAPCVWLTMVCGGILYGQRKVTSLFRIIQAAMIFITLFMSILMTVLHLGIISKEIIGRQDLNSIKWEGDTRNTLEKITQTQSIGAIDAQRALDTFYKLH